MSFRFSRFTRRASVGWLTRAAAPAAALTLALGLGGAARADLLAFYPFDGNANDASGHGMNGTVAGSPTFVANAPFGGSAIQFDGTSNSFVSTPVNLDWTAYPDITFGAWVNASTATATSSSIRGVISGDNGGFGRTIDVDTRSGGLQWSAFNGSGVVSDGAVVANTWTFVAVRYDQASQTFKFNVDGNQVSGSTSFAIPTGTATIGRNPHFDLPFGGEIADAFFFSSSLSDSQINLIRANGPSEIMNLALATPEPSSWMLSAMGGLFLLFIGLKTRTRFRKPTAQ